MVQHMTHPFPLLETVFASNMLPVGVDSCNISCREKQAKAKRLARFSVELSRPVEVINDFAKLHKGSADKQKHASSMGKIPIESKDDTDERTLAGMDTPGLAAIVGLCPDMCPGVSCSRSHHLFLCNITLVVLISPSIYFLNMLLINAMHSLFSLFLRT